MRVDSDEYSLGWQDRRSRQALMSRGDGGLSRRPVVWHAPQHSASAMGACINALRTIVFGFNLVFWLAGIVILGLGLCLLFDPSASDFFSLHAAHPGSFRIVGWLLVAAGAIMTFIGCFGCCGACKLNQCALIAFFFVLILVFFLELAAAVIAYNKQENIRQYIESSMYDTIRNKYASNANYKAAFDSIQNEFECCGVKSYTDWLEANWDKRVAVSDGDGRVEHGIGAIGGGRGNGFGRVPDSCCNENGRSVYPSNCGVSFTQARLTTYSQFIHEKGCADALYEKWNSHLDIIIAVCVAVGAIQLIGMVFAMVLCCCVNADKKKYDY